MAVPWAALECLETISRQPVTFTLRKFVEDPGVISFISSINILFNFMVGVGAAYLSDRIWTRWGRRRPFLIVSAAGTGVLLLAIPLAGNFVLLAAALVLYQFFVDVSRPWEPLYNEVIPPHQRGRAGIFRMMAVNLGILFFSTVMLGQFDVQYEVATPFGVLTGEMLLYWTAAALMFLVVGFHLVLVRETRPPEAPGASEPDRPTRLPGVWWTGGRGGLGALFRDMFADSQARWIYFLYLCPIVASAANQNSSNYILFLSEQMGISKPDLGRLNGFVMPLLVFVFTPVSGLLADRISRHLMFRLGILMPALIQLGLYLYLRTVSGFEAGMGLFIGVGIATAFFQSMLWAVWGPLVFDYIPLNRMGTCTAGFTMVSGLVGFVLVNLGGQWVKASTWLLGNPGRGTYDYSSVLILWALLSALAFGATFVFRRAEAAGRVRPEGRLADEGEAPPPGTTTG
jgi:Na+/melibiose symporter-like transporter